MNQSHFYHPIPFEKVNIEGGFWGSRQQTTRDTTLPAIYHQLEENGHLAAWKLAWKPGMPHQPHVFWDSDLAKWMEAASYALSLQRDAKLEAWLDEIVEDMAAAQLPDGYLNSHFINVEPQKRWSNLRDLHELYCAGHLMEAAVAYASATGKQRFLDIITRYADHINQVFGPQPGQRRGYPGHPEIELALIRLYRATGVERYLALSQYFIEERGRQPYYYDEEARARGEDPAQFWAKTYAYMQAHLPVRQQTEPVGHAVRAAYLYSAMTDLAVLTGDGGLLQVCKNLFNQIIERRMYITGGVGSSGQNEGFTRDYDLPNETAYAETCTGIGMFLFASRLVNTTCDARYSDYMERILYNGILSAISRDGRRFFYVNPLSVHREVDSFSLYPLENVFSGHRAPWYSCACCPPNIARLLMSLGGYIYSANEENLAVHLYIQSQGQFDLATGVVRIRQKTNYPWDGRVEITLDLDRAVHFTLRLRLPGWCRQHRLRVNGGEVELPVEHGYLLLDRTWQPGDWIEYHMDMPVERNHAHPKVMAGCGRTALSRGPLVYCLEGVDNGSDLDFLQLPQDSGLDASWKENLLGGVVTLQGQALRIKYANWVGQLYQTIHSTGEPATITAIPYHAWDERDEGDMLVWVREG